jgi:hypothetical protein
LLRRHRLFRRALHEHAKASLPEVTSVPENDRGVAAFTAGPALCAGGTGVAVAALAAVAPPTGDEDGVVRR